MFARKIISKQQNYSEVVIFFVLLPYSRTLCEVRKKILIRMFVKVNLTLTCYNSVTYFVAQKHQGEIMTFNSIKKPNVC